MTTLAEFLLARITEDEAVAREVRPHEHLSTRDRHDLVARNVDGYARVLATSGRVLAECEAKRRIIAEHPQRVGGGCYDCETGLCRFQQFLAAPYADHPDYQQEWQA